MNLSVLLYREYKLKTKAISFYMFQIIQPTFYLLFMGILFGTTFNIEIKYGGMRLDYLSYLLPGIMAMQAVNAMYSNSANIFNEYRYGVYRSLVLSRVSPFSYIVSKIIIESMLSTIYASSLMIGYHLIYAKPIGEMSVGFLLSVPIIMLSAVFWSLLGALMGFLFGNEEKRTMIFTLLNMPLVFISTVFYPPETAWIRSLVMLNPLTYSANLIREAMLKRSILLSDLAIFLLLVIIAFLAIRILIKRLPLIKK